MKGRIAVIGTGTMGTGIAQTALVSDYEVVWIAHSQDSAGQAQARIGTSFDKAIAKGRMTEQQKNGCLQLLHLSWNYDDIKGAGIVIEAVPEDLQVKLQVLAEIEKHADRSAIIASNTSSISINALAGALVDSTRFVGLHFFNPVPVMKVVEAIVGSKTSENTLAAVKALAVGMGKTIADVNDSPGFVSNRILMIFLNEAILALEEGVATKEVIDTIAKLGFNHPMGPLELADFIGLDVCRDIMGEIYRQTGNAKFKPATTLVKMVDEGRLGKKNGKGFYDYPTS